MSREIQPLEALTAAGRLHRWLEAIKGEPLAPATRPEDRLDGLGALGRWLSSAEVWPEAEAALAEGSPAARRLWSRWLESSAQGPWLRRLTAVLTRQWGEGSLRRSEWERARFWHEQSLAAWRGLAEAPLEVWRGGWRGADPALGDADHERLRARLMPRLLDGHKALAVEALDHGDWPRARMHWQVITSGQGVSGQAARTEALAARLVAYSHGFEDAGVDRGGGAIALGLLQEGRELAPGSATLHRRCAEVGVRSALYQYALGEWDLFVHAVMAVSLSLDWFASNPCEGDGALDALLGEGWVCRAAVTDQPAEAVQALRQALHLSPHHPTARLLLGEALAALAARSLGADQVEVAWSAAEEAKVLLPPSPALGRLWKAIVQERSRGREPAWGPVWVLDEEVEGEG